MSSRQEVYAAFEKQCKAQQIAIDALADRSVVAWPSKDGVFRLSLPDRTPVLCTTITLTEPSSVVVQCNSMTVYHAELPCGTHMLPCGFLYSGAEGEVRAVNGCVETTVLAAAFERLRDKTRDMVHPVVVAEPHTSSKSDFKMFPRAAVAVLSLEIYQEGGTRVEVHANHTLTMGMFSGKIPGGETKLADLAMANGRATVHFDHAPKPNSMDWLRIRVHDGEGTVRVTARYLNTMKMVQGGAGLMCA
jgi:hypothetical protein